MSSLKVKNGKLLAAGNAGGFSNDCGCCDRPTTCYDCCPLTIENGDAVSISVAMSFQSFKVDLYLYGYGVTVERTIPGLTLAGNGVCFVGTSSSPGNCVSATGRTFLTYSPFTYLSNRFHSYPEFINVNIRNPGLDECLMNASCRFQLGVKDFFLNDLSPRTVQLSSPGEFPQDAFVFYANKLDVAYGSSRGFCIDQTVFNMEFQDARFLPYYRIGYAISNYVLPPIGSSCGTITVDGVE